MSLPFELLLGLRYTRAKRRVRFISFVAVTSIICITLGVAMLITVTSVMNGFENESRERILGMASHATVTSADDVLDDWKAVAATVSKNPEVAGIAPYVDGQAMLKQGADLSGVLVRGIDPALEAQVADIGDHMLAGHLSDLAPGEYRIVIGAELAQKLDVAPGDPLDLMIPEVSKATDSIVPRFRRFTVSGIFRVGNFEFDSGLALIDLDDASTLFGLDGKVSGVRLKLRDLFRAPEVSQQLAPTLPGGCCVKDWTEQYSSYFKAVATERAVMFLILSMLIGIAAFNIVSTLVMVVQEKQGDIAILRTLGATPRSILAIFVVQGVIIGTAGTLFGLVLGVSLALNVQTVVPLLQAVSGNQFLDPSIYYITDLPSQLKSSDVVRICVLALSLGLLSTLYPAWRASRTQPAEALRYE